MAAIDSIPKSRITIKYRTDINGKPKDKEIPFKLLVMGDLSKGSSIDRQVDLDERRIRELDGKNLDDTMQDMKMSLKLNVRNMINSDKSPMLNVEIPINSVKSFNPAVIAERVPQLKSLLILKELIKELETTLDNNKVFRQNLGEVLTDKNSFENIKAALPNIDKYLLPEQEKIVIDRTASVNDSPKEPNDAK